MCIVVDQSPVVEAVLALINGLIPNGQTIYWRAMCK